MGIVIVDNKEIEINLFGQVVGTDVHIELYSSYKGVIDCILRRVMDGREVVIEADLWQTDRTKALPLVMFRAGVYMRWETDRYRIINKSFRDCNDFWRELEILISNAICLNE